VVRNAWYGARVRFLDDQLSKTFLNLVGPGACIKQSSKRREKVFLSAPRVRPDDLDVLGSLNVPYEIVLILSSFLPRQGDELFARGDFRNNKK